MCGYTFAQNSATVTQTGDNQDANVSQTGKNNISTVYQLTDNSGVNKSVVIQEGNANQAYVEQYETGGGGNTPGTDAFIKQVGNQNIGFQYMNAPGFNSGQKQTAEQYGNNNLVNQRVDNGYNVLQTSFQEGNQNIATQTSSGAYKYMHIKTLGNSSEAHQIATDTKANLNIEQFGGNNFAQQYFSGDFAFSTPNSGDIIQSGNNNIGVQTLVGSIGNDLDIFQTGNTNYSNQYTEGDQNFSFVSQTGNSNIGNILQTGDNNIGSITSVGNGHVGSIIQSGGMNQAVITQNP